MNGSSFWDLLKESTIIQGLIALVVTVAIVYQLVVSGTVSTELVGLMSLIMGYYFGAKSNFNTRQAIKELRKRND